MKMANREGMAYSPDGRWLSVIADDGMVRLLDTQEEKYDSPYKGIITDE